MVVNYTTSGGRCQNLPAVSVAYKRTPEHLRRQRHIKPLYKLVPTAQWNGVEMKNVLSAGLWDAPVGDLSSVQSRQDAAFEEMQPAGVGEGAD